MKRSGRPTEILLVEDTPEDVELTLEAFSGHIDRDRITVARDGAEALEFMLGPDGNTAPLELPRVVLLDIKLPKVDGLEVLAKLRAHPATVEVPVVLLTSSAQERDMHRAYQLHANSYIVKPVEYDEFVKVVTELGLYWLDINRSTTGPSSVVL